MTSNFLGDISAMNPNRSMILSSAELIAREGVEFVKSMNYRGGPLLSVLLVIRRDGVFKDVWDAARRVFLYQGHDSTTVENGKSFDQLLMYGGGALSDNGKFYKAAREFKDKVRPEPLAVQIYEKIAPGAWYDKGLFDLIDARKEEDDGRAVYRFCLSPRGLDDVSADTPECIERMLSVEVKEAAWQESDGRCGLCGAQTDLYFVLSGRGGAILVCGPHAGRGRTGLL